MTYEMMAQELLKDKTYDKYDQFAARLQKSYETIREMNIDSLLTYMVNASVRASDCFNDEPFGLAYQFQSAFATFCKMEVKNRIAKA